MNSTRRGFTLIELLVVISIISLLASVVLASLTSARKKGKDAAIKEEVAQFATLMNLNYNENNSYCQLDNVGWVPQVYTCSSAPFSGAYVTQAQAICNNIISNAAVASGYTAGYKLFLSTTSGCSNTYSIMVSLNNGNWYCSGSSGAKGEYGAYGDPPTSNPGCYGNP